MTDEYKDFSKQDLLDRRDALEKEDDDLMKRVYEILNEITRIDEELEKR